MMKVKFLYEIKIHLKNDSSFKIWIFGHTTYLELSRMSESQRCKMTKRNRERILKWNLKQLCVRNNHVDSNNL